MPSNVLWAITGVSVAVGATCLVLYRGALLRCGRLLHEIEAQARRAASARVSEQEADPVPTPAKVDHETRWRVHAYPLVLATIQVQGIRHTRDEVLVRLFEDALSRIRAGDPSGEDSDDDVGYRFEVMRGAESIFPDPCSTR